jgi:pyridoxal phosphate enzyme (YggS family)
MNDQERIAENLSRVQERIIAAARRSGRRPDQVTLVAVTKTHPAYVVSAAYQAGLRDFGENRVEEASDKIHAVHRELASSKPPRWHMVGHLQRRKARLAVALFDVIHSVDSLRLAERLDRMAEDAQKALPVLLEINVSGEASKYGFELSDQAGDERRETFLGTVQRILELSHLRLRGLMTMAPMVSDPEQVRPVFVALRRLRDDLNQRFPEADCTELSMGMTDDFEVAVEEGATLVRIGRAIFGERK